MDVGGFLQDLAALEADELFARYRLALQPDRARVKACKEALISLGTLEHSAWEQAHNYGSTLGSIYATHPSVGAAGPGRTGSPEASTAADLYAAARLFRDSPPAATGLVATRRRPVPWLSRCAGSAGGLSSRDPGMPLFLCDQGAGATGISREDFLLRTHPGPTFGFSE